MIVDYKKEEDKSLNLETIELSGNVNLVIDKAEKSGMINALNVINSSFANL